MDYGTVVWLVVTGIWDKFLSWSSG